MAVENFVTGGGTVDPSVDNVNVSYGARFKLEHAGNANTLIGGYLCGMGPYLTVHGGTHDKAVVVEAAANIKNVSNLTSLLFFEPALTEVSVDSSADQVVGFYFPNWENVANIENVQSLRAFQSDHLDAPVLVNGPIFAQYGHIMTGVSQELSPAGHPGYSLNRYYPGIGMYGRVESQILGGIIYAVPILVGSRWTPNRVGLEVISPVAGAQAVFGIYTAAYGSALGRVAQCVGIADMSTPGYKELPIAPVLPAGTYYMVVHASHDVGVAFAQTEALSSIHGVVNPTLDTALAANAFYQGAAYNGTLPDEFSATAYASTSGLLPNIMLRLAI